MIVNPDPSSFLYIAKELASPALPSSSADSEPQACRHHAELKWDYGA